MITKSGILKIHKIILFFFCGFGFIAQVSAENIDVAPLINLDEIQPSYDEELIDSGIIEKDQNQDFSIGTYDKYEESFAVISLLNKITADVNTLQINLKENYIHDELKIYAIDCYISEPYEKKEIAVYLNIHSKKSMDKIFSGWMIKSLPSISSMEHPIYDIWVNDCFKL